MGPTGPNLSKGPQLICVATGWVAEIRYMYLYFFKQPYGSPYRVSDGGRSLYVASDVTVM